MPKACEAQKKKLLPKKKTSSWYSYMLVKIASFGPVVLQRAHARNQVILSAQNLSNSEMRTTYLQSLRGSKESQGCQSFLLCKVPRVTRWSSRHLWLMVTASSKIWQMNSLKFSRQTTGDTYKNYLVRTQRRQWTSTGSFASTEIMGSVWSVSMFWHV